MKTTARRFIGKVLPDGHLSLPEDAAKEIGSVFDVLLMPVAVSMDTVKNSPLSESVFIKNVYREGVAV